MSSPEPSRSLDILQPLSFSTPRAFMTKSWAANVYLQAMKSQQLIRVCYKSRYLSPKSMLNILT